MGHRASVPAAQGPSANKMDQLDRYTHLLVKLVPPKVKKGMKDAPRDTLLTSEKNGNMADLDLYGPQPTKTIALGKFKLVLMEEDDTFGKLEFMAWLLLRTLRTAKVGPINVLPMEDSAIFLDSAEEFYKIREETGLAQVLPKPNHDDWTEMSSEDALTRVFFYGVGSVLLSEASDGNIVCDLSSLADLETRPLWRNYGITAKFDSKTQKIIWIRPEGEKTCYPPSASDPTAKQKARRERWERAKHALKTTVALKATAADHLLYLHFLVAQQMVNATITHLPVEHPVRRLVTPFLFRTTYVNNRASDSLLPEFSMLHRSSGLTYPAMVKFLERSVSKCKAWQPFPEQASGRGPQLNAMADEGRFPFISDGLAYHAVVENFVSSWIASAFPEDHAAPEGDEMVQAFYDALVESTAPMEYSLPAGPASREQLISTVSQFIFCVTAMHELVGSVVEYQRFDGFGFRATKEGTRPDLQAWLISECLLATTSLRTPALLSEFSNYFQGDEVPRWAAFQGELRGLSKDLKRCNAKAGKPGEARQFQFKWFDPAILEVAISV